MPRFFIELSYKGTRYSGFQVQENAITVQYELEKAISTLQRREVSLTGSSRTDAGVHARRNYFHFDFEGIIHPQFIYKINAILPPDIVVSRLIPVNADAHCRFAAISRTYRYYIYRSKNPFLADRAYFFPYPLDLEQLNEAAAVLKEYSDFTSFSKRNTQVKTFNCQIQESFWEEEGDCLVYQVRANRFLRGMVRALVGTMLQVGRKKTDLAEFRKIIEMADCTAADFSAPGHGLFLLRVEFPAELGI